MTAYRWFMTHVTCRVTAKNRDLLRNPTLGNRVWAAFTFLIAVSTKRADKYYSRIARIAQMRAIATDGVAWSVCLRVTVWRGRPTYS